MLLLIRNPSIRWLQSQRKTLLYCGEQDCEFVIAHLLPSQNGIQIFSDLKWRLSVFDFDLFNDKDGAKNKMVLISRMAEHLLQAIPKLQAAIHSLMSRSSSEHSNRVLSIIGIVWMTDSTITSVASVCHNFLSSQQTLLQLRPEDFEIRPRTTSKRAIVCHNPASFDTNSNLASQSWTIKLVGPPSF